MKMNRTMRRVRDYGTDLDADGVLELVGLERRHRHMLPAIAMLVLGGIVGAGLGLLLAPSSGRMLRHDAERKVNDIKERIRSNSPATPAV